MLKELIKISNELDNRSLVKEADLLDKMLKKIVAEQSSAPVPHEHKYTRVKDKEYLQTREEEQERLREMEDKSVQRAIEESAESARQRLEEKRQLELEEVAGGGDSGGSVLSKVRGKAVETIDSLIALTNGGRTLNAAFYTAVAKSQEYYNTDPQRDAFRHMYGAALFERAVGALAALILGETHEVTGALKSWLLRQGFDSGWLMDRGNNTLGIRLAQMNPGKNDDWLAQEVKGKIDVGHFYLEDGATLFKNEPTARSRPVAVGT